MAGIGLAVGLFFVLLRHLMLRLPVLRGVVALGEAMRIGFRALNVSINTTTRSRA